MNNITRRILFAVTGLMLAAFTILSTSQASAQSWSKFHDEDNIFHVLIPENYKINKKMLRMSDKHMLITTELNSSVDQRPYKDVFKQYIVKYDQTLMNAIPKDDLPRLLDKEIERYIRFYTKQEGVLRNKEFGVFNGMHGGDIFISYRDKERGIQSIRVRIMYSDVSRIEQIIIGPEDAMMAHTTKDYFNSIRINNGRTEFDGDIEKEWDAVISPFALFTQLTPQKAEPYMKDSAKTVANDRIERMSMRFHDPVYDNDLFYNVYGYRLNTLMTMEHVQKVIMDRHLKKFKVDVGSIKFTQTSSGDYPVLATKVHIVPPDKYSYMNTISIRAHYYGNFVVVQEIAGNNAHVESALSHNLQRYFRFYPMRGHKKLLEEKTGIKLPSPQSAAVAAPAEKTAEPAAPVEKEDNAATTLTPQSDTSAQDTPTVQENDAAKEAQPMDPLDDDPFPVINQTDETTPDSATDATAVSPANTTSSAPEANVAAPEETTKPATNGETDAAADTPLEQNPAITPLIPTGTIDSGAGG